MNMSAALGLGMPYRRWVDGAAVSAFAPISATGGTITDVEIGGQLYRVHTLLSSGDFVVTDLGSDGGAARALAVGAGASGGFSTGTNNLPGSGAGGEVIEQDVVLTVGTHAVVIGAGGASVTTNATGLDGSDTTGLGLTAHGGSMGGGFSGPGGSGTNGGGGGSNSAGGDNPAGGVGTRNGGNGWAALYAGGNASGGGAGAETAGGNATGTGSTAQGGKGGDGKESSIDGTSRRYGAGAGGLAAHPALGGVVGAAGLGGVPGVFRDTQGNDGTDGLGNGGTGATRNGIRSGKGGSGRFIVRYPLEAA